MNSLERRHALAAAARADTWPAGNGVRWAILPDGYKERFYKHFAIGPDQLVRDPSIREFG